MVCVLAASHSSAGCSRCCQPQVRSGRHLPSPCKTEHSHDVHCCFASAWPDWLDIIRWPVCVEQRVAATNAVPSVHRLIILTASRRCSITSEHRPGTVFQGEDHTMVTFSGHQPSNSQALTGATQMHTSIAVHPPHRPVACTRASSKRNESRYIDSWPNTQGREHTSATACSSQRQGISRTPSYHVVGQPL